MAKESHMYFCDGISSPRRRLLCLNRSGLHPVTGGGIYRGCGWRRHPEEIMFEMREEGAMRMPSQESSAWRAMQPLFERAIAQQQYMRPTA